MQKIHSKSKMLEVIDELNKYIAGVESDPFYALGLADSLYGDSMPQIKELYDFSVFRQNTCKRNAKLIKSLLEEYLETNAAVGFYLNSLNSGDETLDELVEESAYYFNRNEKSTACVKLWAAFERMKTFFDAKNKKESAEEIIETLSSDSEEYRKVLKADFDAITDIGNNFHIRHYEKNREEIMSDSQYDYFYYRCLSLINLCIHQLRGGVDNEV